MIVTGLVALLAAALAALITWRICRTGRNPDERENRFWTGVTRDLAHQMGTPLSALMGWVDLLPHLQDKTSAVEEMGRDVERLRVIGERLGQIASPGRFEAVDLGEVAREARDYYVRKLPSLAASGIEIRVESLAAAPARAHRELLAWAVEGLVRNAIDALDGDGQTITLRTATADGKAILEIEDTGRGLPPEAGGQIFEPGFTTRMGGRGMGLPLARHIVETGHGGRLEVAASPSGRGALVRLTLESTTVQGAKDVP